MLLKVLLTIIVFLLFIIFNIKDFNNLLNHGEKSFIQGKRTGGSAIFHTFFQLGFLSLVYDLRNIESFVVIYVIYLIVYTIIFFKIKKYKESNVR